MQTIDARGRSCPEPVLMTKKAIESQEPQYTILLDNATAKENVTRFATNAGYEVKSSQNDDTITLELSK